MAAPEKTLLQKRGTTDKLATYRGKEGELVIDTDKHIAIVMDGETAGGFPLKRADAETVRVSYLLLRAAVTQGGVASLGFCTEANGPTPITIQSPNTLLGAASFAPFVRQSVQDHFIIPDNWVPPMDVEILWRSANGPDPANVQWRIEVAGVNPNDGFYAAEPSLLDHPFNPPRDIEAVAGTTPNEVLLHRIENIDTTGCEPNGELFFRFSRLETGTLPYPAELIALRFLIRRKAI